MESPAQEFTLHELGLALRKRRGLLISTFIVSLIVGLLVVFCMPPLYEANVKIEVRRESRAPGYNIKATQAEGFSMVRNLERKEELATEAEVVKSRALVEDVVKSQQYTIEKMDYIHDFRKYVRYAYNWTRDTAAWVYDETKYALHLGKRPTPEEERMFAYERLIGDAVERVIADPMQDGDVLEVKFRSSDPMLARDAANAIAVEYLKRQSEARRNRVQTFFLQEAGKMADELHAKEARLDQLKQNFSAFSVDEQRKLTLTSLTQVSDALKGNVTALARATARRAALQTQIASQPEMITHSREVGRNPSLDELNKRLVELEMKRATVAQAFQDSSPAVVSLDNEIANAKKLKTEMAQTVEGTVTGAANPIYQALKSDLLKADAEVVALQAEQASLRKHQEDYHAELENLSKGELQIKDLERRVKTQEDAYLLYAKNREQARVSDELATANLTEIRIIDPARLPMSPVRPKKLMYSGIAVAVAILLAAFAVFMAEYNDRTLSSDREVQALVDLPVLASFPAATRKRWSNGWSIAR